MMHSNTHSAPPLVTFQVNWSSLGLASLFQCHLQPQGCLGWNLQDCKALQNRLSNSWAEQQQQALPGDRRRALLCTEARWWALRACSICMGCISDEAAAAESAVVTMLGDVLLQLQEAYNKDILFLVRRRLTDLSCRMAARII